MRRVVLLVLAVVFAGACSSGGGSSEGDRAEPNEGEVFLDAFADVGPNRFTNSVAVAAVPAVGTTSAAGANVKGGLRSVRGTTAGLYGGSGSQLVCDATAAVNELLDHDDSAQAWADALNDDTDLEWSGGAKLAVDDIATYVGELTSVFLQADTRVTSHGLDNGNAVTFQSVLQRGTAVMVDGRGLPRVRCAGFNPLLAPKPAASPKYLGEPWDGFDKTKLLMVTPGPKADTLRIVDIHTKETIEIFLGQGCACDRTKASATTTTTLFEDETTTTTSKTGRTTTTVRRTTTTPGPTTTVTTTPPTTATTAPATTSTTM